MLVNFIRHFALLLSICACGMPNSEIVTAGAETRLISADAERERHTYRLGLSKVADVAVGEKFYVTAVINDCEGQVLAGEAAEAEITLHIRDGNEYNQLATVKANEGAARFYVMMQKAGNDYVLQAEVKIAGETIATLSGPFNAVSNIDTSATNH